MAGYIGSATAVVSNGGEKKVTVTASGGQTAISNVSYAPGQVDVYHNGVHLVDGTDYTATNGTSITLTVAAAANDQIVVRSLGAFQLADTVSASGGGPFAGVVTFADGADIITASAGTSNFRAGVNAGNSILSGGNFNVAVGDEAGTAITTGDQNTFLGYRAGTTVNTAVNNVAVGTDAMQFALTADNSTFVGCQAGKGITGAKLTGNNNTVIGANAGLTLQGAATQNIIVGSLAADAMTTGSYNVILGVNAAGTSTTGGQNIVIGQGSCGQGVLVGDRNVVIGDSAGQAITSAAGNVVIGAGACSSTGDINGEVPMQTATNCVILGNKAQVSAQNADSQHCIGLEVIGNGNNTFTFGKAATDTSIAFANGAISNPSDQRYKEDIVTSTAGLSFIKDLRPVTFKWKKEKDIPSDHREYVEGSNTRVQLSTGEINHGFIAQEVKAVIDAHSEIKDGFSMWSEQGETGGRQRLSPTALIPMLVKAIQELEARIATLEG